MESFSISGVRFYPDILTAVSCAGRFHLEPRVMATAVFLARHPQMTLPRNEILDAVWQTRGSDEALTQVISKLRQLWKSAGCMDPVIQTIAKSGYRLLPAVEWGGESSIAASPVPAGAETLPSARFGRQQLERNRWIHLAAVALVVILLALVIDDRPRHDIELDLADLGANIDTAELAKDALKD